jgi:hypothetical protein
MAAGTSEDWKDMVDGPVATSFLFARYKAPKIDLVSHAMGVEKMRRFLRPLLLVSSLCLGALSGCAQYPCCGRSVAVVSDINAGLPASTAVGTYCERACDRPTAVVSRIQVVGYGSQGSYTQYTAAQQKLMAMRAAEVDGYRKLAEQIQGFRISGSTTVAAFAIQNDSVRTYVDSFIRGARVTSIASIGDGNFQANVELDVTTQFVGCLTGYGNCGGYYQNSGCMSSGCTNPSAAYFSY